MDCRTGGRRENVEKSTFSFRLQTIIGFRKKDAISFFSSSISCGLSYDAVGI
jgi:hypothetical protein